MEKLNQHNIPETLGSSEIEERNEVILQEGVESSVKSLHLSNRDRRRLRWVTAKQGIYAGQCELETIRVEKI